MVGIDLYKASKDVGINARGESENGHCNIKFEITYKFLASTPTLVLIFIPLCC